ncbi:heavy metal-binding domain-containing protein [Maribacter chungangensis]|uniref:Heavy metal-binding domain-containing protein n=1 Tax=Maribacter chungangensis TaxID=1069117 RepID=A0ABW3B1A1_9FLAO
MKLKASILLVACTFLLGLSACKDKTKEKTEETKTQTLAANQYRCPMDCEDGKTYTHTGSCTVCNMDLKPVSDTAGTTCSVHQDGNCSCNGYDCACENCPEHG